MCIMHLRVSHSLQKHDESVNSSVKVNERQIASDNCWPDSGTEESDRQIENTVAW